MHLSILKIRYLFSCSLLAVSLTYAQTTYYISSSTGNDSNNGTSTVTPWKSWANVYNGYKNTYAFPAGTKILVKCGDTISGAMYTTMNGTSGSPCMLATYGTGARPVMLGDFSQNIWIAVAGHAGCYKTYTPTGGLLSTEQWEYSGGSWQALKLAGDISHNRETWLNNLSAGSIGPTNNENDTIFIHTFDGTMPTPSTCCLAWDGMTLNNSKYTTIRDWEMKGFHSALFMWADTNLTIRNCLVHDNDHLGYMLEYCRYFSVDSCRADSCAYTCFYSYLSPDGKFTYDTVTNVTNIVKGRDWGTDREMCAFGHQGDPGFAQGNNNVKIDHCFTWNVYDSAIDSYYDSNDTITNNIFNANQAGIYQLGNGYYVANNTVTIYGPASTRKGTQIDATGAGLNKTINNTFNNVQWGLAVNSMSNGSSVQFSGNTVNGYDANSYFDYFATTSGVTSTNNSFFGPGQWLAGSKTYSTLTKAQAAGWEVSSTWANGPDAPTGTFTVKPDTLPINGGVVILQWTSQNATSAYIDNGIGTVPTNGYDTLTVTNTTLFELTLIGPNGSTTYSVRIFVQSNYPLDQNFSLSQNYPNPFNGGTMIEFVVPNDGYATLKVFDTIGREITTSTQPCTRGTNRFYWNSDSAASGVYYYTLKFSQYTETRRMVLLR